MSAFLKGVIFDNFFFIFLNFKIFLFNTTVCMQFEYFKLVCDDEFTTKFTFIFISRLWFKGTNY